MEAVYYTKENNKNIFLGIREICFETQHDTFSGFGYLTRNDYEVKQYEKVLGHKLNNLYISASGIEFEVQLLAKNPDLLSVYSTRKNTIHN